MKKFFKLMLITFISILCLQGFASAQTITYLTPETDPSSVKVDNYIISKFEEAHPGVKVNITHANIDDLLPKLATQLKAGTAPDVAFFSPRYVAGLAAQGFLLPLGDLFEDIGDISREFVTSVSDGEIYDIANSSENQLLYYRTDLFEKAGIKPPTTYEELLEAAEALTLDIDGDGNIDQYGIAMVGGMPENYVHFTNFLWANGGDYFDENNNVAIDSPEAIEALNFLGKLSKFAPPSMINDGWTDVMTEFTSELTAMVTCYGRVLANITKYNPELATKIDVLPTPVGPSGTDTFYRSCLNIFVAFSGTKHPEIAREFIKFYISGDQYLEFLTSSVAGHSLPVRRSWMDNPSYFENPAIMKYGDIIKKTMGLAPKYGFDFTTRFDTVNPYLGEALSDPTLTTEMNKFFHEDVTAEQALKNVANAWRKRFDIE